ncbi:MAG TPA: iron-sulfur cluster insertion protein ErpA [Acidimicrobiales bacterium]|nr:iron-sulfur cluster insertion protein ErpA [Acidimicrobiales bacterium]
MITLTDSAAAKVKSLIEEEGEAALALRVAVRPGGCSGFSYEMFFDTDVADDDKVQTYGDVRVVVDPSSAVMLEGATLDFKDGLESGFSINNPNAQRTCGCGSSFS